MNALIITLGILTFIAALAVIILVAMQDGKKGMSGVITGSNGGSYYDRNKSGSKEAKLSKATAIACVAFAVLVLALFLAQYEPSDEASTEDTSAAESSTEVSAASESESAESEIEESASAAVSE